MTPRDNENLDDLFKKALEQSEQPIAFNEDDWNAMEELLNKREQSKGVVWLRSPLVIGAVAAMLLLVCGLFLRPDAPTRVQKPIVVKIKKNNKPATGELIEKSLKKESISFAKTDARHSGKMPEISTSKDKLPVAREILESNGDKDSTNNKNSYLADNITAGATQSGSKDPGLLNDTTAATKYDPNLLAGTSASSIAPVDTLAKPDEKLAMVKEKARKLKMGGMHNMALSIIAAPDFNGVHSAFNRTQIGVNAGLLLSIGITSKLTLSAGAVYAKKPYEITFQDYYTAYKFKVQPTDVDADCRVLDIPLNINYQVYEKGSNRFSAGAGISSYFMLRESYHYDYYGVTGTGPTDYSIKNRNKHLFGVLNINANYQRRISPQLGINFQPYIKLPLTNIGYGRVNLQSTGLAVGASWYFNTSAKPK